MKLKVFENFKQPVVLEPRAVVLMDDNDKPLALMAQDPASGGVWRSDVTDPDFANLLEQFNLDKPPTLVEHKVG